MRISHSIILSLLIMNVGFLAAQQNPVTTSQLRNKGYQQREAIENSSIVKGIPFTSIGPTVMSGRVTDIAVDPNDATHFYIAYASGGLWETINNGTTFTPLFDNQAAMTIGDIAVNWKSGIIWVGTGENNSSRSSYAGTGIFWSENNGDTWHYGGLGESHHIGRIILDPNNDKRILVAVAGHLYTPNKERGVYLTTDGAGSWKKVLYIDENTGAIDITSDPNDSHVYYAAMWHRERKAWNFTESGKTSAIYKSNDAGETWNCISCQNNGFPNNAGVGRIGIASTNLNGNTILYAVLDNQNQREKDVDNEDADILTIQQFREISKSAFLKLDNNKLEGFLSDNGFPEKYTAKKIKKMVEQDEILPSALADYLSDANSQLFNTPVIGMELYRSNDAGVTWFKTHNEYLDDMFYSYGYYFGQIRVAANNPNELYVLGVPILHSQNGGSTFSSLNSENVHADNHALWMDPHKKGHLILGNDGGINISYDNGVSWLKCNTPAVGQFYSVAVDNDEPYNVYGGLQDNGVWVAPSNTKPNFEWYQSGANPYHSIMGGDGMQVAVDTRNNNAIYTGYQFGNYFRVDKKSGNQTYITPHHELGKKRYRFNWQSPIWLSVHNPDILYLGSNMLHRSMNQGKTFKIISGDLTVGGKKGDVAYGTLTTICESPLKFGLIYTGSDDGLVYLTKDGGNIWQNISGKLPANLWVSRVWASAFNESRVYVALNGYRNDDFAAYIYVSEDYGSSWKYIGADLPSEPVNVIKEDPINPDILFVGTDNGLYVSINRGITFMCMSNGLPAVAVHDLAIQPREKELVVATHGRSLYIANIKELEKLTADIRSKSLFVFELNNVNYRRDWGKSWNVWLENFEPSFSIPVYADFKGNVSVDIKSADSTILYSFEDSVVNGINYIEYGLVISSEIRKSYQQFLNDHNDSSKEITVKEADNGAIYLHPGTYVVTITHNNERSSSSFEIKKRHR